MKTKKLEWKIKLNIKDLSIRHDTRRATGWYYKKYELVPPI